MPACLAEAWWVKHNGGTSIAVYPEKDADKVRQIYDDKRCSFICRADYSAGSDLEKIFQLLIDKIATTTEIERKEIALAKRK